MFVCSSASMVRCSLKGELSCDQERRARKRRPCSEQARASLAPCPSTTSKPYYDVLQGHHALLA